MILLIFRETTLMKSAVETARQMDSSIYFGVFAVNYSNMFTRVERKRPKKFEFQQGRRYLRYMGEGSRKKLSLSCMSLYTLFT